MEQISNKKPFVSLKWTIWNSDDNGDRDDNGAKVNDVINDGNYIYYYLLFMQNRDLHEKLLHLICFLYICLLSWCHRVVLSLVNDVACLSVVLTNSVVYVCWT